MREVECPNCNGIGCMHLVLRDWWSTEIENCDGNCCPFCKGAGVIEMNDKEALDDIAEALDDIAEAVDGIEALRLYEWDTELTIILWSWVIVILIILALLYILI